MFALPQADTTEASDASVTSLTPQDSVKSSTSRTETTTTAKPTPPKESPNRDTRNPSSKRSTPSKPSKANDKAIASDEEVAEALSRESADVLRAANERKAEIDDLSDLDAGTVEKAIKEHHRLAKRFNANESITKGELEAHKVTISLINAALDTVEAFVLEEDRKTLASANGYTDMQVGEVVKGTKAFFAEETKQLATLNRRADNTDSRLIRVERLILLKVQWWMPVISVIVGFIVWILIASHTWSNTITLATKQKVTIHSPADEWWFPLAAGLAAAIIIFGLCVLFTRKGEVRATDDSELRDTYVVQSSSSEERSANTPTKTLPKANAGVTQTPVNSEE